MKNIVIIDVDTDRKVPVMINKPESSKKPTNIAEATEVVSTDMQSICEGLLRLINMAHSSGMLDKKETLDKCIEHLESGFDVTINNEEKE